MFPFFNELFFAIFLGLSPISEVRGAVIYAFSQEQLWLILPAALANFLVAPLLLLVWDLFRVPWWGRKILGKRLDDRVKKFTQRYEKYGLLALVAFIGIPLPVTGVYTGTLIARLVGIKKRFVVVAAAFGVAISATITFLIASGVAGL